MYFNIIATFSLNVVYIVLKHNKWNYLVIYIMLDPEEVTRT